ncbi:hypothetical protein ANO11243_002140 [Dothideomycetidae sp. 11243]|nr:hypothetical protein ANO11243_002140 [fungal sp. No.11243]
MNAGRQVNQREGVVGKRKTSSYGEEGGKDFCMAGRGVTAAVDGLGDAPHHTATRRSAPPSSAHIRYHAPPLARTSQAGRRAFSQAGTWPRRELRPGYGGRARRGAEA